MFLPELIQQQKIGPAPDEGRLEQPGVALPARDRQRGHIAWRDLDGVTALAGR